MRMLDVYDKAVEKHAIATSDLKLVANSSPEDFQLMSHWVSEAFRQMVKAKLELRNHRVKHGC